jgi:peptidoglycan/LPS O-acetylase OafA/YrhL
MHNPLIERNNYRADIDGLRAIAVISVILFHLNAVGWDGGYLGVDIFFVISGFLIMQKIRDESDAGTFHFKHFYLQRLKRLVPALLVALVFTLLGMALVFSPNDLVKAAHSLAAAVFWGGNIHAYLQDSYFAESHTRPLLHLWSLGVEAQFYLIWPILYLLAAKALPRYRWGILLVTGLISYALTLAVAGKDNDAAFFLLPMRLFEFMFGAALCMLPAIDRLWIKRTLWITGLAAICAGIVFATKESAVHAPTTLLVCAGAALLIKGAEGCTIARWLLGNPLMSYTGRISYELYLFHWPLIVFLSYLTYEPITNMQALAIMAACSALSIVTYHCISCPIRFISVKHQARFEWFLIGALAIMMALLLAVVSIRVSDGWKWRLPETSHTFINQRGEFRETQFGGYGYLDNVPVHVLGVQEGVAPSFILLGDSFASQYARALDALLKERNLSALMLYKNACFIAAHATITRNGAIEQPCAEVYPRAMEVVAAHDVPIMYVQSWSAYKQSLVTREGAPITFDPASNDDYYDFMIDATERLRQAVAPRRFILIGVQPGIEGKRALHRCLFLPDILPNNCEVEVATPQAGRVHVQQFNDAFRPYLQQHPEITYINPSESVCKQGMCYGLINGQIIYSDLFHFTTAGATFVMRDNLDRILAAGR